MMKKISVTLLAVLLLLGGTIRVHAVEFPDQDRKGSLTLELEWEGEQLDSGSLTICRVGRIVYEGDGWKFAPVSELEESGISLENLNNAQLPKQLEQMSKEKALPVITVPIQEGQAVFTELTVGLYLVTQKEACEGFAVINPFLMSLPQWEVDRYVYDLTALPKVALEPQPPETEPTEPTEPSEPELPQTGQLNWPVPVLAVAGLALFALGWYLYSGKKNGHES